MRKGLVFALATFALTLILSVLLLNIVTADELAAPTPTPAPRTPAPPLPGFPAVKPSITFTVTNFRMSDSPNGPAITDFPAGIEKVYVIFDYANTQGDKMRIRVYDGQGNILYDKIETYTGAGTASIELTGPDNGVFPTDFYLTNRYVFVEGIEYLSESYMWTVGGAPTPVLQEVVVGTPPAPPPAFLTPMAPPQPTAAPKQQPTPTPEEPRRGISPTLIVGGGALLVVLIVLVWRAIGGSKAAS